MVENRWLSISPGSGIPILISRDVIHGYKTIVFAEWEKTTKVVSDELMGNTQVMADMLCDIIGVRRRQLH